MPGKGTHAPLTIKVEDLPDQPGFPIVEVPKEPQQDNDKSDGNGVIIIPSPGMPQASTPSSGSHTAAQGIETDHQMEENDMEIARTEPELLPTFGPVADDEEASQAPDLDVDYIAKSFMSPDEIAADKAVQMSAKDVADADLDAARKRCIYTRGQFCGQIHHFYHKYSCFQSARQCYKGVEKCAIASNAQHLDDKDKGKNGCAKWDQICKEQTIFCKHCGSSKEAPKCKSRLFKPSNLNDLAGN